MAENIVASLFGLTPWQVQQQQRGMMSQAADEYAMQDPFQRAAGGMFRAGAGLGGMAAQALGMVNPQVEEAKRREAILSQADIQTPKGLLAAAEQARMRGDVRMQMQLQLLAQNRAAEISAAQKEAAETDWKRAQTEKEYALAEQALRGKPNVIHVGEAIGTREPVYFDKESNRQFVIRGGQPVLYNGGLDEKGTNITNVMPGSKEFKDIPEFRHKVQTTIKPQIDTIYAADQAAAALDLSIKTGNFTGFETARRQLVKAVGDSNISLVEVKAAGSDPSLIGGGLDYLSTAFTGTPTLDTQRMIRETITAMKKVARRHANKEIQTQKKLAKMSGYTEDQIEEALRFDQIKEKKTRTLTSGKVVTIEE